MSKSIVQPPKRGDKAVNAYSQEVEIMEVENGEVVFRYIDNDSPDVMSIEEFETYYRRI